MGRIQACCRVVGWIACVLAIFAVNMSPYFANDPLTQWLPWIVGLVLLGIPHGAVDHIVGSRLIGFRTGWGMSGFVAGYLAVMVVVGLLWLAWPLAALLLFLLVAAVHFGEADVAWSRETGFLSVERSVPYAICMLVSRGAMPVLLPALAHPELFADVSNGLLSLQLIGPSAWDPPAWSMVVGWVVLILSTTIQWTWSAWRAVRGGVGSRVAAIEAMETLGLLSLFLFVPPVLAVGIYFNAWHAIRHISRLVRDEGIERSASAWRALFAFHRAAMPLTGASVILLLVLGLLLGNGNVEPARLGRVLLVLLSMLTLPHAILVAWMNVRGGIWPIRSRRGNPSCSQPGLGQWSSLHRGGSLSAAPQPPTIT